MKYRFLGNSGLLVSTFSLGAMFGFDQDVDLAYELMETAFKAGVNLFDTAELYSAGKSETMLGQAIQRGIEKGTWKREDLVITTKLFFGGKKFDFAEGFEYGPNDVGLSRKHIVEGIKASLGRLGLDYVDLLFCHRPDPYTPIEETVRAMNFAINQGWAFYWGTSEWTAAQIIEACDIADRLGLQRPLFDQAQYNMFEQTRVNYDFVVLYKKYKYGLTTWSPLASGLLTGKYNNGIPEGSRLSKPGPPHRFAEMKTKIEKAIQLEAVAQEVGCSMTQLALAWCASNQNVSTVLLGATSTSQLEENLKAAEYVEKITPEIKEKIDAIIQFKPISLPEKDPQALYLRGKFL